MTETGLAPLPDGLFWRVGPHGVAIMGNIEDQPWKNSSGYGYPEPEFRGETELTPEIEDKLEDTAFRYIRNYSYMQDVVYKWTTEVVHYRHPILFWRWTPALRATLWIRSAPSIWTYEAEVTADNVREITASALLQWETRKRNQTIYGDYPPKVFTDGD